MLENSLSPLFYFGETANDEFIFQKGYCLIYDTSYALIKMQGNQTALLASLARLKEHIVH